MATGDLEPQCSMPWPCPLLICAVFEDGVSPLRAKLVYPVVIERSLPVWQQLLLPSTVFQHLWTGTSGGVLYVISPLLVHRAVSFWRESHDLCFVIFRTVSQLIVGCVNWQLQIYLLCCKLEGRSSLKDICYSESTLWAQDCFCGFDTHISTCYRGIGVGLLRKVETGA